MSVPAFLTGRTPLSRGFIICLLLALGSGCSSSEFAYRNADWFITLGGDGHQPATEPGNPDIVYAESQQGHLNRVDRTTGETVHIQPQPEPGDPPEVVASELTSRRGLVGTSAAPRRSQRG